eukprot:763020-Hanusia_phi.AAC.4
MATKRWSKRYWRGGMGSLTNRRKVKVSIDAIDASGQTALHLAAKWGRLSVVKVLIDSGVPCWTMIPLGNVRILKSRTAREGLRWSWRMTPAYNRTCPVCGAVYGLTVPGSQLSRRSAEIVKKVDLFQKDKRKRALVLQKKVLNLGRRERLDEEGVWDMMKLERELEEVEHVERVEEERWEELNNYMKERPKELKEAAFQAGLQSLRRVYPLATLSFAELLDRKKTKEEAKRALEEVAIHSRNAIQLTC